MTLAARALLLFSVVAASSASAQGTVSTQGFGYPPGQLGVRNMAMGGALSELDPYSPLNPAASLGWPSSGLSFQYAPEFRRVEAGGAEDRATVIRFPLVAAAIAFRERFVLTGSASTFLDRTWGTELRGVLRFGTDSAPFVDSFQSAGAITDFRVAGAWAVTRPLRVGLAVHVLSGSNRLSVNRTFAEEVSGFASFSERSTVSYAGSALSAGVAWQPVRRLELGVSARAGGRMRSYRNDTLQTRGHVPHRLGWAALYSASGTTIAAHAAWDGWSRIESLAGPATAARDAWDIGAGVEVSAPRLLGASVPIRLGIRRRGLPFDAGSDAVRETTVSGGFGVSVARQRLLGDFSILHASRSGGAGASERGWILGFGLIVRP